MSDDRQTTETGQISETDIFQMTGRRVRRLKQGQISDETKICISRRLKQGQMSETKICQMTGRRLKEGEG